MTATGVPSRPLLFNPFDPAMRADPYPVYRRLRETEPVHRSPLGFWVLSRHADVVACQRDARLSLLAPMVAAAVESIRESGAGTPMAAVARHWLLLTDGRRHRRFRAALGRLLSPRSMEALRPRIEACVGALLDALPASGSIELIEEFAQPLPIHVLVELLELDAGHAAEYATWSQAIGRVLESVVDLAMIQELSGAMLACERHFEAVVAERRRRPGGDLLSALLEVEVDGGRITDEEAVSYVSLMLGAAAGTTANLVGNGLLALLRHPDQLRLLRDEPAVVPGAVDELLRFDPPAQLHGRWTLEDIEVAGIPIPRGSKLVLLIGAANRDPVEFPDPDRLDLRRASGRSATFGGGSHYCLGAAFARLEAQVALPVLLDRYPRLGPIVDGPRWRDEHVALRSLSTLTVDTGNPPPLAGGGGPKGRRGVPAGPAVTPQLHPPPNLPREGGGAAE